MNAVTQFERAFAEYVGAEHAIAMCNGTATLHTALAALGVERKIEYAPTRDGYDIDESSVAVPPLTMASTTIAVLHAGGVPVFVDVDPDTWLMDETLDSLAVPVSLYGLHYYSLPSQVDDAAQTLRPHGGAAFTSYSFQASKILALGEGGMLVTNNAELARKAREFASLGYSMPGGVIDTHAIRHPTYARHHSLGYNYRMSEIVAEAGLKKTEGSVVAWRIGDAFTELRSFDGTPLSAFDSLWAKRKLAASYYRDAIAGTDWITPQHVPEGWTHDYWCYAVALEHAELWDPFVDAVERYGGERPYAAWCLTYQEPAFRHLAEDGCCPVAEDLQPRLVQLQTNNLTSARKNADAVAAAILEVGGVPA